MESKISKALDDLSLIKNSIEDSKQHSDTLYLLCISFGCYYLLQFFLKIFLAFIGPFAIFIGFLSTSLTLSLFVFYLYLCYKEKKYTNRYYLSILSTWGLLATILPIILTICELTLFLADLPNSNNIQIIKRYSDILLFIMFLIVCSFILSMSILKLFSVALLTLYLVLDFYFSNMAVALSNTSNITLSLISIYYLFTVCIGYFILGSMIKRKKYYDNK